jgi:hypothetical protein
MILILRLELDNETIEISEHIIKDEITQVPYSSLNIDSSDLTIGSGSTLEKKINSSTLTMTKDEIKDFISSYGINAEKLQALNKRYILYIIFLLKTGYMGLNDLDVFMKLETSESKETFILNCIGESGVTLTSSFERILVSSSQNRIKNTRLYSKYNDSNDNVIENLFNPNFVLNKRNNFSFVESGTNKEKYFLDDSGTNMYSMISRGDTYFSSTDEEYSSGDVKDFDPNDRYIREYLILSREFVPKIYLLKYSIQNANAYLKNGMSQEFLFYDVDKKYSIVNKSILDELLFNSMYIARDKYKKMATIPFIKDAYSKILKDENSLYIENDGHLTIRNGSGSTAVRSTITFYTSGKSFYDTFEKELLEINTTKLYGSIAKDLKNIFLAKIRSIFKYSIGSDDNKIDAGLDYAIKGNYTYTVDKTKVKKILKNEKEFGDKLKLVDSDGNVYNSIYKYVTTIEQQTVKSELFKDYTNDLSKLKRLLRELSDICSNIYIEEYEDDYNGKTYSEEDLKYKFTKLTKEDTKKMSSTEYFYIIDNNRFKKVDYSYIYADGNENANIYALKPEYKKYKVTSLNLSNTNFHKITTRNIVETESSETGDKISTEYMLSKEISSSDGTNSLKQTIEKIQDLFNVGGINDLDKIKNRKNIIYNFFNINSVGSMTEEEGLYLVIVLNLLDNYYSYLLDDKAKFADISFDVDPAVYEFWHTVMLFKQCFVDTTNIMERFNYFDYRFADNCTPEKYVINFIRAVNHKNFIVDTK